MPGTAVMFQLPRTHRYTPPLQGPERDRRQTNRTYGRIFSQPDCRADGLTDAGEGRFD